MTKIVVTFLAVQFTCVKNLNLMVPNHHGAKSSRDLKVSTTAEVDKLNDLP